MFASYVKRAMLTLTAVSALALLAAAAPALSLRAYQPAPVDFELAAPATTAASSSSATSAAISKPLRAPKRFNLVGLRWRSGADHVEVEVRTRRSGGGWSAWAAVPAHSADGPDPGSGEPSGAGSSAPIWAGEADWVQYRLSRRVRGMRLHFVNTNGTSTGQSRALTALRRAANAGAIALARPLASLGASEAGAAAARPKMVYRAAWGSRHCKPRRRASRGNVKVAFVHHTVNTNSYSRAQAKQIVLGICRYHRNSNGWDDIGYNFLVDKYGTIYEGRAGGVDKPIVGAQAQGYNSGSTGIANIGDHRNRAQNTTALRSVARIIRWKLPLHGSPTAGRTTLVSGGGPVNRYARGRRVGFARVAGHRDANRTTCPGGALYRQLPSLRRLVGNLKPGKATALSAALAPGRVARGASTIMSGRLRLSDGRPVSKGTIEIQRLLGSRWDTFTRATTGADGRYRKSILPSRTRRLRALFKATRSLRAATSRSVVVNVTP